MIYIFGKSGQEICQWLFQCDPGFTHVSPSPLCLDDLIYVDYLMGGSQQENGQSRTLGVGDVHRLHRLHDVLQFYKYKKILYH